MKHFENNLNNHSANLLGLNSTGSSNETWEGNSITSIRIICVILLRVGFILVQVGSIPVENVYIIIFRNVIEIAVAIFSYGFLGYYLSFGRKTIHGIVNYDGFIGFENANLNLASIGFSACIIGTALTSSMLIARVRQLPLLTLTITLSAIYQPILICWIWSQYGWMKNYTLLEEKVSLKDHGGNLSIHVPTSIVGLLGAIFLGRRIMKVQDIDPFSLGKEYVSGTVSGYFFVMIGLMGFHLPIDSHTRKDISRISVNCIMAMGGGILTVAFIQMVKSKDIYKYWKVMRCLQGGLAGIVMVSSGIDLYNPAVTFGVSIFGALLFFISSLIVRKSPLEDCCNIISVYLVCGTFGTPIPAIFTKNSVEVILIHVLWQLICLGTVIVVTCVVFVILFCFFTCCGVLKNDFEEVNHERANILYGRLNWRSYYDKLFASSKNKEISPNSNRSEMTQTFNIF
ncbi:ammonium transporter 3-like isoform X1 [Sitophilus oryzae]|uniref:Ammonium transporter 3-like isoform X1 n=1 Tax=Sitophilus oryzae TaxID=7048 RepID=A0A6J2XKJ5_SITOR|nr:ammonium transporter 3-like isoform X1 [Sitophilus oryzae]